MIRKATAAWRGTGRDGDGDLTNDPEATWTAKTDNGLTMYQGQAQIDLGGEALGALGLYRFDPKDPQRAQLKNTILFYTDYGYEITVNLDGQEFTSFTSGKPNASSSLWIDRDGNQRAFSGGDLGPHLRSAYWPMGEPRSGG